MFKSSNAIAFNKQFKNNEDCYKYLEDLKWGNTPYGCIRCKCKEFSKGRTSFYRRCKKCGYDESVTANTIFHGLRMPILKAFHMIFRLSAKKKGMSTVELGNEVGVQQKSAWLFKRKVQSIMFTNDNEKLKGEVNVDETLVGGYSAGKKGRSLETKSAVLIAVEILDDGRTGNINMEQIENFKSETIKNAIEKLIDDEAIIKTDKFHSYKKLEKEMPNLSTAYSEKGSGMEQLHKQIMQFKNWLRGVHHKCSKEYLFAYINEYVYRFNKRNMKEWLFDDILKKIIMAKPMTYQMLKVTCEQNT